MIRYGRSRGIGHSTAATCPIVTAQPRATQTSAVRATDRAGSPACRSLERSTDRDPRLASSRPGVPQFSLRDAQQTFGVEAGGTRADKIVYGPRQKRLGPSARTPHEQQRSWAEVDMTRRSDCDDGVDEVSAPIVKQRLQHVVKADPAALRAHTRGHQGTADRFDSRT